MRSSASFYNFKYQLVSLRSSNSCLLLLPHLPVTSMLPSIFPSITCFRKQFQRQMLPIHLTFLLLLYVRYSSPPWLYIIFIHFSHDRSNLSYQSFSSKTFLSFSDISDPLPKCPSSRTKQSYIPNVALYQSFPYLITKPHGFTPRNQEPSI